MENKKKVLYGIKIRLFLNVIPLVIIPLIVANLTSYIILNDYVESMVLKQLEQSNEDIYLAYSDFIEELDENTIRIITYNTIQESLVGDFVSNEKRLEIRKYLTTYIYSVYKKLYYIDNKNSVIATDIYNNIDSESILNNKAIRQLEGTYGQLKLAMEYGSDESSVMAARYVRHMELNKQPGILVIRIDSKIFEQIFSDDLLVKNSHYLLVDNDGLIAYNSSDPAQTGRPFRESDYSSDNKYIYSDYVESNANWKIISFISRKDVFLIYRRYQFTMYGILIATIAIAVFMVIYLSNRFTKPIERLTHAMMDFDDGKFNTRLSPSDHTEIGDAAKSFNHMADEISRLLTDIQQKQKELRRSELKTLVHQINPHFVYNTLDNINMLLRMNGDKKTSNMVQSLSRFLRISLSRGSMFISLSDEFDHGRHYLEIHSIRYDDLFEYEMSIQDGLEDCIINKFIIQPILENSIKHGFSDRYSGGRIKVAAYIQNSFLVISVKDNGVGIAEEKLKLLNSLCTMSPGDIAHLYPEHEGGYGVNNIVSRLRLSYGDEFEMGYFSDGSGTECRISINFSLVEDKRSNYKMYDN